MSIYKGFSTYNRSKKFRLTDFELVKQDLVNHFNIRKGEKLMNPDFGTVIWDTLFNPLDQDTVNIIQQDVRRIVAYDPRLAANNVLVTQYDQGIQIQLDLTYIPDNQTGTLQFRFDQQSRTTQALL
jgi:phage baseplate assembly protein W